MEDNETREFACTSIVAAAALQKLQMHVVHMYIVCTLFSHLWGHLARDDSSHYSYTNLVLVVHVRATFWMTIDFNLIYSHPNRTIDCVCAVGSPWCPPIGRSIAFATLCCSSHLFRRREWWFECEHTAIVCTRTDVAVARAPFKYNWSWIMKLNLNLIKFGRCAQ